MLAFYRDDCELKRGLCDPVGVGVGEYHPTANVGPVGVRGVVYSLCCGLEGVYFICLFSAGITISAKMTLMMYVLRLIPDRIIHFEVD